jgi:hypothetical protein
MTKVHKYFGLVISAYLSSLGYLFVEMWAMKVEQARQGQQITDISENVHLLVDEKYNNK